VANSREVPRGDYYPNAKANLVIRLDEFGNTGSVAALQGALPQQRKSSGQTGSTLPPLTVTQSNGAYFIGFPGDDPSTATPQQRTTSTDGYTVRIPGVIPLTASLGLNGIRTADTLNLEFNFIDCPLDPRVVRSCAVEFYLGCVTADDYAQGVSGGTRAVNAGSGNTGSEPLNVVPDTYTDIYGAPRTNLRFQGFADKIDAERSGGLSVVRMTCTDNTRLLIAQEAPPSLSVGAAIPLDQAVANYLANFQQMRGMSVICSPAGTVAPTLNLALAKTAFRPTLGVPPAKGGGAAQKFNIWDYITQCCAAVGFTVRVEGTMIVIQQARTLYGSLFIGTRPDDPFTGRTLVTGRQINTRLMIYGRNLISFNISRNYGRREPECVEVRCYSGKLKTTLTARFPEANPTNAGAQLGSTNPSGRQQGQLPGNSGTEEKFKIVEVSGIEDVPTLQKIAQGIYEQVGRNNIEVKIKTRDLGSYGGSDVDPDLLDLKAGDSVDVEIAQDTDDFSSITHEEDLLGSAASTSAFLQRLGYDSTFADAYAAAYTNIGLPRTFRVKKIGFDWDKEKGVDIDMDLCNFIEVRADQALANGEPTPPGPGGISSQSVTVDPDVIS
jgi:hypothetical protein